MSRRRTHDLGEVLPSLVERMNASYGSDGRTHHIDRHYLPSRSGIIDICDLLLELSYPGYYGRQNLTRHNIRFHVGELLPRLHAQLVDEINQCLCFENEARGEDVSVCEQQAQRIALQFLERVPDVRAMLAEDVQAAYDGDPAATCVAEVLLAYPGLLAITLFRYAHELHNMQVPMMPRFMTEHAHRLTGIDIHPGASIGRSLFIDHGTGVVIGETATLGDYVKIYQGVTLGALSFPKDERGRVIRGVKRHPTVGNRVTIYANAAVLGGQTELGDGAVVGGSVFLAQSVEHDHQVSNAPPQLRIRQRDQRRDPDAPPAPDYQI